MITFSIFSGGHPTAKDEPNVPATEDGWQHWQSAGINKECNVPLRIKFGKRDIQLLQNAFDELVN